MGNKKRRKLRVAFRKNRKKRARRNAAARDLLDDQESHGDLVASERLSGKGDLTRHRTIIGVESGEDGDGRGAVRDVDESKCLAGRVVSAAGLNSIVQTVDGRRYECTVRRVLRTIERDERNVVVTGDRVLFQPVTEEQGVVERVEPRHGVVSRTTQGREHMIASNVDQVLIVVSAGQPPLKPGLIDRCLISAEKGDVRPLICINKVDLVAPSGLQPLAGVYGRLGYRIVLASAVRQLGIGQLRGLLQDRATAITGQSGVGKSSLLNVLQPGLNLETSEISDWSQKGRHTTRRATLHRLDFGGWVVDTPGVRSFGLWDVIPEEVEGFFPEFRPFVVGCKFPDCSHTHESDCGVKTAVAGGLISSLRYESYLKIVTDGMDR